MERHDTNHLFLVGFIGTITGGLCILIAEMQILSEMVAVPLRLVPAIMIIALGVHFIRSSDSVNREREIINAALPPYPQGWDPRTIASAKRRSQGIE